MHTIEPPSKHAPALSVEFADRIRTAHQDLAVQQFEPDQSGGLKQDNWKRDRHPAVHIGKLGLRAFYGQGSYTGAGKAARETVFNVVKAPMGAGARADESRSAHWPRRAWAVPMSAAADGRGEPGERDEEHRVRQRRVLYKGKWTVTTHTASAGCPGMGCCRSSSCSAPCVRSTAWSSEGAGGGWARGGRPMKPI